nr:hypothetical protein [Tanacetum cinerariifolium]
MTSFDYRLNPLYPIKECSSCGALYTTDYCCSIRILRDKIICDLDKTPDFSQRSPQTCPKCGHPVNGHYCQGCALLRKKFKEYLFTSCIENGILQDSSEPSNDNPNVVNALREPFVVNQDPGIFCHQCTCKLCGNGAHYGYNCLPRVPISPNPEPFNNQTFKELPPTVQNVDPKYDLVHDSPNVFDPPPQLPFYSCEFCRNNARYGHYCTPQVSFVYLEPCYNQDFNFQQEFQDFHDFQKQDLCCENYGVAHDAYQCHPMNTDYYHEQNSCYDHNSFGFDQFQPQQYTINHPIFNEEEKQIEEDQAANARYWKIHACYDDDDDDYAFAITPNEPINSLSMGDEHLDTIPATESDKFIKSSVENLIPNPRIDETDCDPEEETYFIKRLLYDNSSPHPSEEFVSENSNAEIKSFSPSPILAEDSDSLMEESDLSFTLDYLMPLGIEEDDYDSERDILILDELLRNDSLSLPEKESFYFDIPSFFRPPAKPPDGNT